MTDFQHLASILECVWRSASELVQSAHLCPVRQTLFPHPRDYLSETSTFRPVEWEDTERKNEQDHQDGRPPPPPNMEVPIHETPYALLNPKDSSMTYLRIGITATDGPASPSSHRKQRAEHLAGQGSYS